MPNVTRPMLVALSLVLLTSCAAGWKAAAIAVATVDRAVPAAMADWRDANIAHERLVLQNSVAAGKSADQVQADVNAWRGIADRITLAFSALLDSTQGAKDAIQRAAAGNGPISAVLATILPALSALIDALRAGGIPLPSALADLNALLGGG